MKIYYYNNKTLCSIITVTGKDISVENYTENIFHRAFGRNLSPTYEDFEEFLKDRCFPETRRNKKQILESLNLDVYDPLEIVKKTEGRMAEDNSWLKVIND